MAGLSNLTPRLSREPESDCCFLNVHPDEGSRRLLFRADRFRVVESEIEGYRELVEIGTPLKGCQ